MAVQNAEIAAIFDQTAELLEIKGEDQALIRAYRRAARTVESMPSSLAGLLERGVDPVSIPGIGQEIASKIASIVTTSRFELLDSLKRQLPGELGAIAAIPGIGPKRVKLLYENLRVRSIDDLRRAAQDGRLRDIRGLGTAVEKRVLAILSRPQREQRIPLPKVQEEADTLLAVLGAGLSDGQLAVSGSFRRRRDTVSDLDLLVTEPHAALVSERLIACEDVAEIRVHGPTRTAVILRCGLQVDLRITAEESWGAAMLYFTGSKRHNVGLRALAGVRGWKLNEYGLFAGKRRISGESEEEIYGKLGLQFIPPELREDRGEIALAKDERLPDLVEAGDILGDLHVRANWTADTSGVAELVAAARGRGYRYIALIDDGRRAAQPGGIDPCELARRSGEVDSVAGDLVVLKGVEAAILPDGSIDLPDAILPRLDLVVGAVQARFDLPAADQTDRIIRAMGNPHVKMIAHPTGRLFGEREPCALEFERLAAAARDHRCLLEINADPRRLDLDDLRVQAARLAAAPIALGSNASTAAALAQIRYGIDQARRGWLTADDIVNARPPADIKAPLAR